MKFMNRDVGEFRKTSYKTTMSVRFCLSYDPFKLHFIVFKVDTNTKRNVVTHVAMTLHVRAKMFCYDCQQRPSLTG